MMTFEDLNIDEFVDEDTDISTEPLKLVEPGETERNASAKAEQGDGTKAPKSNLEGLDFEAFAAKADVTNTESKPLPEAPHNATPEQKQEYEETQVQGAIEQHNIRQDAGLEPVETKSDTDLSIEQGNSDVATYRNTILPKMEELRNEYMEQYPKATPEQRDKYATQQIMKSENVTQKWLDKAKAGKTKLTDRQQGKLIDNYFEKYSSGDYESTHAITQAMVTEGFDAREIDIATKRMPNRTSFAEAKQDRKNAGNGDIDSFFMGAKDYLVENYDVYKQGNYTPMQVQKGQELMVVNMMDELFGMTSGMALFGADLAGIDMQGTNIDKGQNKRINRDTANDDLVGPLARAGGFVPSLGAQVSAPMRSMGTVMNEAGAINRMAKLKVATLESALGGVMAMGELKLEQRKNDMAASEIVAWGAAVTMAPIVLAMGYVASRAMLKPVVKGIKNLALNQEDLAWKHIEKTLTDEELAQIPKMLEDMQKVGLFSGESEVQKKLLAAARIRPQLAADLANELKYNTHAQKEFLNYYRAISKATGTSKETSKAAAQAFDDLIAGVKAMTKGAQDALDTQVHGAAITADALEFSKPLADFTTDVAALPPSLPRNISEGLQRLIKGDKDDQITMKMVQDLIDGLSKYGEDTQNYAAKILAKDLKVTRDDIIESSGLDLSDAQDVIQRAKSSDATSKLIEKMLNNNVFGKMFKRAKIKGAWNLDAVVKSKDIGEMSKQLDDFLDALPANERARFEEVVVDIFAQAFDKSSKAAQTLKISDFGKLANSINVFKEASIQSPAALAKLDLLETIARISEFDGKLARSVLGSAKGDILSEKALVDGIGFGIVYKIAKNLFDKFAGTILEGTAYRRQLSKILDNAQYGPKATTTSGIMDQQDLLLNGLYDMLAPISTKGTPSPGAGRNFPRNMGGDTRVKPTGKLLEFFNVLQDKIRYRNQAVNTMFFKKHEGEPFDASMVKTIAEAVDAGELRVGAGEVFPIPGQNGQMYSVGSQLKFKSTWKLATAMRRGEMVKLIDVLPEKYNKDFYKNFPNAKHIEIEPYAKGTDASEGGHMDIWNGQIGANVENAEVVGPMQANIDLSGNNIRQDISNILHEIQHFLAAADGLPNGGGDVTIEKIKATLPKSVKDAAAKHGQSETGHAYGSLMGEQIAEGSAGGRTVVGKDGKPYMTIDYTHEGPSVQTKRDLVGGKKKVTTKVVPGLTEQHERGLRDIFGDDAFDNPLALRNRDGKGNMQADDYTPIAKEDRAILNAEKKRPYEEGDLTKSGYAGESGAGIDLSSKTSTAISKIWYNLTGDGTTHLVSKKSLENMLRKEGVSKKEIALVTDRFKDQTKNPKAVTYARLKKAGFTDAEITEEFGKDFIASDAGKIDISQLYEETKGALKTVEHPTDQSSYAGISREFDDAGSQSTRILRGPDKLGKQDSHSTGALGSLGWSRAHPDKIDGKAVWVLDEFQSDWAQGPNKGSYPIDYSDFKKIMIVDGIDQAIKNNMTTMIIPIDRSGELHGSNVVRQMYSDLQKGILPKIRKQLAANGLKIETKVVKETIDNQARVSLAQRYLHEQSDAIQKLSRDEQFNFNREIGKLEGSYLYPTSSELKAKVNILKKEYGIKTETPDIYGNEIEKHFEISIEPKYKVDMRSSEDFMNEYRKSNRITSLDDIPDDDFIAIEVLSPTTPAQQQKLLQLESGREIDGFNEMDVWYDASGNPTMSKALADDMGLDLRAKVYKSVDVDGDIVYNDLRGVEAKELGFISTEDLKFMKEDLLKDMEVAYDLAGVDDEFMFYGVQKAIKNAKTPEDIYDYVKRNVPGPGTADEIITHIRITVDDIMTEAGGSFKTEAEIAKDNFVKVRWDMLGLVGAVGLSSQMETLKKTPKEQ